MCLCSTLPQQGQASWLTACPWLCHALPPRQRVESSPCIDIIHVCRSSAHKAELPLHVLVACLLAWPTYMNGWAMQTTRLLSCPHLRLCHRHLRNMHIAVSFPTVLFALVAWLGRATMPALGCKRNSFCWASVRRGSTWCVHRTATNRWKRLSLCTPLH